MESARLDDLTKLGRYSMLLCLFAELVVFNQLGNMLYMVYAGSEPSIVACGEHDLTHLAAADVCHRVAELQANNSCELQFDVQFESINYEWRYLCASSKEVKNSISIQMVGVMLGSMLFGQMSDMWGRKPALLICLFSCSILSSASSFTPNLFMFTVCRFFIGVFNGGQIVVFLVYMIENLPKKHRLWINAVITWSPNMAPFAVVVYYSANWRTLAQVLSVTSFPVFLFCFFLYESPRFLIQKGRTADAKRVLLGISKFNGIELDEASLDATLKRESQILAESSRKKHYHFGHLFYTWKFTTYTLVLAFSFMVTSTINYGLLYNMEKVSGSIYWNSALIGTFRYLVNLLCAALDYKVERFGRKVIHAMTIIPVVLFMSFVVVLELIGLQQELAFYTRIALLGVSSVVSQSFITNGVCSNELFPTPVRNLAYAFSQLISRLGVVFSPQIFYLADFWSPLPYLAMAALSAADLVLFEFLIPETKGQPLNDRMPKPEERIFTRIVRT